MTTRCSLCIEQSGDRRGETGHAGHVGRAKKELQHLGKKELQHLGRASTLRKRDPERMTYPFNCASQLEAPSWVMF